MEIDDDYDNIDESVGILDKYKLKLLKKIEMERQVNKYIKISFRKDFMVNGRDIEIFEPPKILGDVFEGLIGAVFVDGGI